MGKFVHLTDFLCLLPYLTQDKMHNVWDNKMWCFATPVISGTVLLNVICRKQGKVALHYAQPSEFSPVFPSRSVSEMLGQSSYHHMLVRSAGSSMPDMDNNPWPLRPNNMQGQANECSYRPEDMVEGGRGWRRRLLIIELLWWEQPLESRAEWSREEWDKKWRWKKQGMTVNDIKGLFWSTDERLIMINASYVSLILCR